MIAGKNILVTGGCGFEGEDFGPEEVPVRVRGPEGEPVEWVEVEVVVAAEDGGGLGFEGDGDELSIFSYAAELRDGLGEFGNVLQGLGTEDPVEAVVGEGERGGAGADGLGGVSGAGLVEEFFDEVEADDVGGGEGLLEVAGVIMRALQLHWFKLH